MSRKKKFVLENVLIENYAAEGKCIARYNDKVIFVEGVVPGDIATLFVYKNRKDWAEARVNQITTYAANRTDAFCGHFDVCGGCKWQMLPYNLQLQYKEQQVKDQLKRIGRFEVGQFLPILGCADTRSYRNKVEFTFSNKQYIPSNEMAEHKPFDQNVLGFHAPRLFDKVIDIEHCHLQREPTNAIKNFLRSYAHTHELSFCDIRQHTGLLRNLIIRVSTTGESMVNLIFGEDNLPMITQVMNALVEAFPEVTSWNYTINAKFNDSIYDLKVMHYQGKDHMIEQLEKFKFKISPKSFFQTNTRQAEALYSVVRDFSGCTGKEVLYDLYCGTGSIGIFLSDHVHKLIGVDTVAEAIEDAKLNATLNQINNASFFAGDVIKVCQDSFFAQHGHPDVVIIDPPRAGCHDTLIQKLLELQSPKIVYVSCNPATQARDVALLAGRYDVQKSQAVDMFPHTHHVENVLLLTLKSI
jgi:23S rRNA (uracil1939-C5)-methyltransferase